LPIADCQVPIAKCQVPNFPTRPGHWVLMQFREPAAQELDFHSTTEPRSGPGPKRAARLGWWKRPGLVPSHSSDVKSSHFAVEWSRDLDPVATAPRFC